MTTDKSEAPTIHDVGPYKVALTTFRAQGFEGLGHSEEQDYELFDEGIDLCVAHVFNRVFAHRPIQKDEPDLRRLKDKLPGWTVTDAYVFWGDPPLPCRGRAEMPPLEGTPQNSQELLELIQEEFG